MTNREFSGAVTPRLLRSLRSLGMTALLLPLLSCGLLDTNQPNIVDPGTLDSPEGAQTRRIGALTDFTFAQDGDGTQTDGHILLSGLMADEFVLSTTPPTEQEIDQRRVFDNNSTLADLFLNLHRARAAAEVAAAALEEFSPDPTVEPGIAEMHGLAGYTYIFFGESFCSGVPYSRLDGDTLVFGQPTTTVETFELARTRFEQALAHPGLAEDADLSVTNLASVGLGRALVDLGRFTEAAVAVSNVPTDFQYVTEHAESPLRLQNAIWSYGDGGLWSLSDEEGGVGLPYRSAEDPRVPFVDTEDVGLDGSTDQFTLLKYADASASVVVADGIEARLIEAEAVIQPTNPPLAVFTSILNDLRDTQGLDPLAQPANRDAAIDMLFSERAFWLFATGHRLGDMRRLIRQYSRTAEEVFPSGGYLKGGEYGEDVNLPIPVEEQNNPSSSGCIDREA